MTRGSPRVPGPGLPGPEVRVRPDPETKLNPGPESRRPIPPRFGRENSRDFPDPDCAGIGGFGIPEIPIWPGSGESAPMPWHRGFRGLKGAATGTERPPLTCALRLQLSAGFLFTGLST